MTSRRFFCAESIFDLTENMFLTLQKKKKIFPFCHLELARKHDKSLSLFASNKKVLFTKSCAGEI